MVQQQPDWLPARQAVFEALWARWRDTCDKPVRNIASASSLSTHRCCCCRCLFAAPPAGQSLHSGTVCAPSTLLLHTPPPTATATTTALSHPLLLPLCTLYVPAHDNTLPLHHARAPCPCCDMNDQRPMAREALLPELQLRDAQRVAGCMLAYLSSPQHHTLVEPLLDLFAALAVRTRVGV